MIITVLSIIILIVAYFLLLYAAVGLIQDKRLFSSAPKEILAVISDKKERFRGARIVGWLMAGLAVVMSIGAFVLSGWDGVRSNCGFPGFFVRFLIMLYLMELYDIFFFDWFLLCRSGFYPHFYPETKEIISPKLFGFNKKTHIAHFLIYLPASAVLSLICLIF